MNKKLLFRYFVIAVITVLITSILMNIYYKDSIINMNSLEEIPSSNLLRYYETRFEEKYNINVVFNDTENISLYAEKFNATIEKNDDILVSMLICLEEEFSKYDINTFEGLTIVLFDSFSDNTLALASKNSNNECRVYLSDNDEFIKTIHHELFHIIEYKDGRYSDEIWNTFNPKGFKYQTIEELTNEYVYGHEDKDVYFVSTYAKVSEVEDRAETFAVYMQNTNMFDRIRKYTGIDNKISYLLEISGIN